MKLAKKLAIFTAVIVIAIEALIGAVPSNIYFRSQENSNNNGHPIRAGVLFYRFDDPFVVSLRECLKNIEETNEGKIKFDFYDSKNDQALQNETINTLLGNANTDILILSLVDLKDDPKKIISEVKEKNIPVIFVSKRPINIDENIIKSYDKAYYIVPDSEQAGILQGKILVDLWNKNKETIDTNKDNIMQYVMLRGDISSIEAINRTKYSIVEIESAGIKVEKLASEVCDWSEDTAKNKVETLLLSYGNKIEVIIANNDAMAIGAIKALQKYGYNKGSNTKTIPVVGVDETQEACDFIKKGFMAGSIAQDPNTMANALYKVSMHLIYNNIRINCGDNYKCDESGKIIELPFEAYVG
jgi:methyl-galactoside transport system substrate-binding protein